MPARHHVRDALEEDLHKGWLVIRRGLFRRNKRRFFRLSNAVLAYYKYEHDLRSSNSALTNTITSVTVETNKSLEASNPLKHLLIVQSKGGRWVLVAPSYEELQGWMFAFRSIGLFSGAFPMTPQAIKDSRYTTFAVHLPDVHSVVVMHAKPTVVNVRELKTAVIDACNRHIAAQAAAATSGGSTADSTGGKTPEHAPGTPASGEGEAAGGDESDGDDGDAEPAEWAASSTAASLTSFVHFDSATAAKDVVVFGADRLALKAAIGDFWLENESLTLDRYGFTPNDEGVIDLRILSKDHMPLLFACIPATKKLKDAFNKEYVTYCVTVRFENTEWTIRRRFNEFRKLHEQLVTSGFDMSVIPTLPTTITIGAPSDEFIEHRREKLERFVQAIVGVPEVIQNIPVMSWLGVLSTARDEGAALDRQVIHLSRLPEFVHYGDIVLFKCKNVLSGLQRKMTGSDYDHVGFVYCDEGGTWLVEATGDGVVSHPILARLRSYSDDFAERMAIRRVIVDRTPEMKKALDNFVTSVEGKPYRLTPAKLFRRTASVSAGNGAGAGAGAGARGQSTSGMSVAPAAEGDSKVAEPSDFFCSELVAAALQVMGVLPAAAVCSTYWPTDFGMGGRVEKELAAEVTMEPEVLLSCEVKEVQRAAEVARF